MLRLNISQQYAKLGLNIQEPLLMMKTTRPQVQLSTQAPKLEISQPAGKLEIDQTPCRASYGIKNNADFSLDNAALGRQTAFETIGRIAEEGDRLARIESKEKAIVNMAMEACRPEPLEVTLAYIELPDIRYVANPPKFNYIEGKVDVGLQRGQVELDLRWGKVEGYISPYNSIRFWTTENKVDMSV